MRFGDGETSESGPEASARLHLALLTLGLRQTVMSMAFLSNRAGRGNLAAFISPLPAAIALLLAFPFTDPEDSPVASTTRLIIAGTLGVAAFGLAIAGHIATGLREAKITGRGCANLTFVVLILTVVEFTQLSGVHRVRTAATRSASRGNMQQIALLMHSYADAHGAFPPPAIYSKDGKPLLSWRVLLLSLMDQDTSKFLLDEPWDSPHNFSMLKKDPPRIYARPNAPASEAHLTYYQVFVGKGAAFEGPNGVKLADFPDGLRNTFLLVEAAEPVPWTKPEDLTYSADQPLPKIGGLWRSGFNAAFADGSVDFFLHDEIDEKALRALITRNGSDMPPKR